MSPVTLRTIALAISLVLCGCVRQPLRLPDTPAAGTESALPIAAGCFRCLVQAFEQASAQGAAGAAFEASALLVLRSKELGLSAENWLDRARTLGAEAGVAGSYVEMLGAVSPHPLGVGREIRFDVDWRANARDALPEWRRLLRADKTVSEPFRLYLELSLVCSLGRISLDDPAVVRAMNAAAVVPLIQYRLGLCDPRFTDRLRAVRDAHEEFVEADFPLGEYELTDPAGADEDGALLLFRSAATYFPDSSALQVTIGNLFTQWEEWSEAVDAYDAALQSYPEHPDALRGRMIGLSNLQRFGEAIVSATALIDGGQWYLGDAYYWRAWNLLQRGDVMDAKRDVEHARAVTKDPRVPALAGVVEWRLEQLDAAEHELREARAAAPDMCEVASNLGGVLSDRREWPKAVSAYEEAASCYEVAISRSRETLAAIQQAPSNVAAKARLLARNNRALSRLNQEQQLVRVRLTELRRLL